MPAGTKVRIGWQIDFQYNNWNEICVWAIEKFGLPGDKFETHATEEYMDFYFVNQRDAILFELTWG